MRASYSFLALLVASGSIAAACAADDANKTKLSRPNGNRGGTANGSAGRGNGGTTMGQAGGGGDATAMGTAGDGNAGTGADAGSGGTGTPGTGGAAGGSAGAASGRGGSTNGGRGGTSNGQAGDPATGGGGEGGTPALGKGLYVGTTGDDAAEGTRPAPFSTLAHAASVAESGDTIVFLDGAFGVGSSAVDIPDGVDVVAENPGAVTFESDGGDVMNLLGTSLIDGFVFDGLETLLRASSDAGAIVTVKNSRFTNCANSGAYPLDLSNGATMILSGTPSTDWGDCAILAHVVDDATLTIDGGILHFNSSVNTTLFDLNDSGTLNLTDVTATDGNRHVLVQAGSSVATITDSTIRTLGDNVVTLGGQSTFTLENSDLSIDPAAAIAYTCIQTNMDGVGAISLLDSHVHDCSDGVKGVPPGVLTVSGTEIDTMTSNGISFDTGSGGVMNITGSHFHDLGLGVGALGAGMAVFGSGGGANIATLTVRDSLFESLVGLRLAGAPTSDWDLGILAEPGGNTFLTTTSSLQLYTPQVGGATSLVSAVGNTWIAGQQGADGAGHYAPSTGKVLEVVGGYTSGDINGPAVPPNTQGRNYTIGGGPTYGATLRLAEIP